MFSRSASYAVCAMSYMARVTPDSWVISSEIACAFGFPPPFLTKVLRRLTTQGLLSSQRGKSGGFRLARPAQEISLREIIHPFSNPELSRLCLLDLKSCSPHCSLHGAWRILADSFSGALARCTLAEVAPSIHAGALHSRPEREPSSGGKEAL